MYNRYIPQPDGSYRRNQIQEPRKEQEHFNAPPPKPPEVSQAPANCSTCPNRPAQRPAALPKYRPQPQSSSAFRFLRQLLPKNFETEDLLVVLLLLLMAGDCKEDQNSALLTLALYLFL